MAVKIRLKRLGKLKSPHYRIVVADSRTKRDGRVIEEIGRYVPTTEPSIIEINSDRAVYWLGVGAQPTEQVAALLKLTGDLQKSKGDASAKSQVKPQAVKEAFVADTKKQPVLKPREEIKLKPKGEEAVAEEVAAEVAVEETAAEAPAEEVVAETPAEEVVAEAPAAEEAVAEQVEAASEASGTDEIPATEENKEEA
ncbi:MAG: hypothetical protein RLZZ556_201 [Actinomycetota bacterium]